MRYYGPWFILSNVEVTSLADFQGMSVMLPPTSLKETWLKSIGAEPIYIVEGEEFSSLQSGLGDALLVIIDDWKLGLNEIGKYIILPSWRSGSNTSLFMNQSKYDSLSPDLQNVINEATASVIRDGIFRDVGGAAYHMNQWYAGGVKPITLTGADGETYASSYSEAAAWPDVLKKIGQADHDRMRVIAKIGEGCPSLGE